MPAGPTTASGPARRPAGLLVGLGLVLAVVAVALASFLDVHASARPLTQRHEAVGVIAEHTTPVVGAHEAVLPGQRRARAPDYDQTAVGSSVAAEAESGASSAANGARLNEQLRLTERYGAGSVRELPDGRMRFYGEMTPAKTPGEMAGARLVREWDPATGSQRTWYETLDQDGKVRIVRPETGGPKTHYTFGPDGSYTGSR